MTDSTDAISIIDLAAQKFGQLPDGHLIDADKTLFEAVDRHEVADFQADTDDLNDPASAEQWGTERILKADRLVWLLTTPEAVAHLSFRGLQISGAKIEGELNLAYATVSVPLIFESCAFTEPLNLENSKLRTLQLKGTHVAGIQADEMQVEGSVSLSNGFKATGEVRLGGVTIGGQLDCSGGKFHNPGQSALNADAANIAADVFLRNSFEAIGEVNLRGVTIGGQLDCSGGKFRNQGQTALNAAAANVAADVFLCDGFEAEGEVNLGGVTIEGQLDCSGGKFRNKGKTALNADAANIAADVFLCDGFEAEGEVNLRGVTIGGQLDYSGGKFHNQDKTALCAAAANIAADVFLCDGFDAVGEVNLSRVMISGNLECTGGKFRNQGQTALNAAAANVAANIFLRNGFEATGEVNLVGATIGGQLACTGGKFHNAGKTALNADAANIAASVFLSNGFEATGEVNLRGATIGGQLACTGGKFHNAGQTALNANAASIAASVYLRNGFEATGEVNLIRATIGGNLECTGGRFLNKGKDALYAEGATISGSVFLRGNLSNLPFRAEGNICFLNATIDDRVELGFMNGSESESIILDLSFAKTNVFSFSNRQAEKSWMGQIKQGQLYLNGLVYSTLNVTNAAIKDGDLLKWLRLQIKKDFNPQSDDNFALQPYEQLAAVLKANGHQEAATEVLIAKEDDRRRYGGLTGWDRAWSKFLGLTIAHGYRPQNALFYSLLVVLVGWGLFGDGKGLMTETNDSPKNYAAFEPLVYSIDTFTPVIDLHQESAWRPDPSKGKEIPFLLCKSGKLLRIYFWFQIVAGWVLTSLWVAGFTGLVRSQK